MFKSLCTFWKEHHVKTPKDIFSLRSFQLRLKTVTPEEKCQCINYSFLFVGSLYVPVCVLSRVLLYVTPWTIAHQDPLSMKFSRQEYRSGLPFSPPGDLSDIGMEPMSLMSIALAGRFFTTGATWEAMYIYAHTHIYIYMVVVVQSLSHVRFFATPWTAACQASLSISTSRSLLKLMSIDLVMPSNHLILCCPFLLLASIFPSIRVFSNESALCIRWPKYWSFSFNISPSNEY